MDAQTTERHTHDLNCSTVCKLHTRDDRAVVSLHSCCALVAPIDDLALQVLRSLSAGPPRILQAQERLQKLRELLEPAERELKRIRGGHLADVTALVHQDTGKPLYSNEAARDGAADRLMTQDAKAQQAQANVDRLRREIQAAVIEYEDAERTWKSARSAADVIRGLRGT